MKKTTSSVYMCSKRQKRCCSWCKSDRTHWMELKGPGTTLRKDWKHLFLSHLAFVDPFGLWPITMVDPIDHQSQHLNQLHFWTSSNCDQHQTNINGLTLSCHPSALAAVESAGAGVGAGTNGRRTSSTGGFHFHQLKNWGCATSPAFPPWQIETGKSHEFVSLNFKDFMPLVMAMVTTMKFIKSTIEVWRDPWGLTIQDTTRPFVIRSHWENKTVSQRVVYPTCGKLSTTATFEVTQLHMITIEKCFWV